MPVKLQSVDNGSVAQKAGLAAGATLFSVNSHEINDMLDYEFYTSGDKLELAVMQDAGKLEYISLQKQEYEPLGCNFESYLIDKKHSCKNKCMFCFIDQLPKGMRETLYFKDDDERLSFLYGNYITLTNLSEREIERIKQMRISPINISVHTTSPELRVKMMTNPNAGEVLKHINEFALAGIKMNCQLVLCRDVNDGEALRNSVQTLASLYPAIQSIAAVPAGLTKYREGLYPLQAYDKQSAHRQLDIMLSLGEEYKQKHGVRLIYPGDEWFLLAQTPVPDGDFYDEYLQLENGVGMWRLFHDEFMAELETPQKLFFLRKIDVATGALAYPLISKLCKCLCNKHKLLTITVHKIDNEFFGGNVCVTGLVTGTDLIKQLKGKLQSRILGIPDNMLRDENDKFLDDITIKELEHELKVKIKILPQNGAQTLNRLLK